MAEYVSILLKSKIGSANPFNMWENKIELSIYLLPSYFVNSFIVAKICVLKNIFSFNNLILYKNY